MKIIDTALPEVKIIALTMHRDDRGFFCERFRVDSWRALGLGGDLVQQNHSRSLPNVLRGLHFQHSPWQGKLVGVTRGCILDVAVDIRPYSPTYKQSVAVALSDENAQMLWVPGGFAHGFCVLGNESADVVYYVSEYYDAAREMGLHYADASIAIDWPLASPRVSARDAALPLLSEIEPSLQKVMS